MAFMWNTSARFSSFMVPPNDMCCLRVILLIIIVKIAKEQPESDEMWIS